MLQSCEREKKAPRKADAVELWWVDNVLVGRSDLQIEKSFAPKKSCLIFFENNLFSERKPAIKGLLVYNNKYGISR